ncbi:MAG: glycerol-3-phosphate dehydrogenase C-terminal domain-containing protein [Bacilli bacterium]
MTPIPQPRARPEIGFILDQAGQYLAKKPTRKDVLCVFAGLRPLAAPTHSDSKKTKEISRSHKIYRAESGLISITGGKWTTYRAMAEDVLNAAIKQSGLSAKPCSTANLKLHGYLENTDRSGWDYVYGSDIFKINEIISKEPGAGEPIHPNYPFKAAHVIFAARNELAQTVEDVLARRVRMLFLDARRNGSGTESRRDFGKGTWADKNWENAQIQEFKNLAWIYFKRLAPQRLGMPKLSRQLKESTEMRFAFKTSSAPALKRRGRQSL